MIGRARGASVHAGNRELWHTNCTQGLHPAPFIADCTAVKGVKS
jgi:hypothetical protein